MTNVTVIFLVIAIVAIAAALWMYLLMYRTRRLRDRFGPEYDRALESTHGKARRAESILEQREKRISKLNIRPLTPEQREHFAEEWRAVQARFVDDPKSAVALADRLLNQVMEARNYPTEDFEQRAADISVEYPSVVQKYRAAHEFVAADPRKPVSTDDLRRAMQDYRSLFEELVEVHVTHKEEVYK